MDDQTATAKILIIDDDPQTPEVAQKALGQRGVELLTVATAAEAEQVLAVNDISLIILNLVLPDADGRNFLARLSQQSSTAAIPVFVVLGFTGPQPRDECLRLGAAEIVEKPIDRDQLAMAVALTLEHMTSVGRDPHRDPLTGLFNRAAFAEAYSQEQVDAEKRGTSITVALLDLDRLAAINERHGRGLGDTVLRNVGSILVSSLRQTDVVARWEEDEYAVLFPQTDTRTAVLTLTKALAALGSAPVIHEGDTAIEASFSAGVATVVAEVPLDEAMARADGLLLRAKTEGASHIRSSEDGAPQSLQKILVAEDDRVAAALVTHRLERAGFEVLHRANGKEALSTALANDISLFVLDIRMPGIDGIELLKRLRDTARYAQIPVLMLTSLGREEDIARAFKLGASDYLTKPFSPVELLARVQRLLRRVGSTT